MTKYLIRNLNEMSTIGYFQFKEKELHTNKKGNKLEFKVFVASESNLKPSFHISWGKVGADDYKCAAILLHNFMVIEYPNTKIPFKFPKRVFKSFREFLDKFNIIYPTDTNWITLLKDWNKEHQKYPEVWVDVEMLIPDVNDFQYASKFKL